MHTIIGIGVEVALIGAGALGSLARADQSMVAWPDVPIYGATAELIDLGRWAVRRFQDAGLDAPPAFMRIARTARHACPVRSGLMGP